MTIQYTVTAKAEIADILAYIAQENPTASRRMASLIEATVDRAHQFPSSGRVISDDGIRALLVGRHSYRLLYAAVRGGIVVMNVRSTWRLMPWEAREGDENP